MTIESDGQNKFPLQELYRESTANFLRSLMEFSWSIFLIAFFIWLTTNDMIIALLFILVWGIVRYWMSRKEIIRADTTGLTYSTFAYTLSTPWDNLKVIETHTVSRLFWQQEDELKLWQTGVIHFNGLWAWVMQRNCRLSYQIPLTTLDRNWRDGSLGCILKQHRPDLFQVEK